MTRPPTETRAKDTLELLQFGLAADKRATCCSQGFTRQAAQSPSAGGRFKTFQLYFAERIAHAPSGKCAVNAIRKQGLSRAGSGHKAWRSSSLNRRVPCSRSRRRDPKCRRPLRHWLCRHVPEVAGRWLCSSGRAPHGCPMRHGRRELDRRHAHGAHRKAPSRRHQCACRPYPHIRRQCPITAGAWPLPSVGHTSGMRLARGTFRASSNSMIQWASASMSYCDFIIEIRERKRRKESERMSCRATEHVPPGNSACLIREQAPLA